MERGKEVGNEGMETYLMAQAVKPYPHSAMIPSTLAQLGVGFFPFSDMATARTRSRTESAFQVDLGGIFAGCDCLLDLRNGSWVASDFNRESWEWWAGLRIGECWGMEVQGRMMWWWRGEERGRRRAGVRGYETGVEGSNVPCSFRNRINGVFVSSDGSLQSGIV